MLKSKTSEFFGVVEQSSAFRGFCFAVLEHLDGYKMNELFALVFSYRFIDI